MSEPTEGQPRWEQWAQGVIFAAALLILIAMLVAATALQLNRAERLRAALAVTATPQPSAVPSYPHPSQRPAYPIPEPIRPVAYP